MSSLRILLALSVVTIMAGCGGGGGGDPAAPSAPAPASVPPPPPLPLPAGTVSLSAPSYTVAQSTALLTATVNRADGSRDVTVGFATANGTAIAGTDYTARSGTLVWAA